ncbi:MAG: hypothetical protein H7A25_02080 [Leptospiraceae bacterium]|nr:hypothetical protein [Leptospiraceae bacterium]MCP5498664.1 hypothetical protein [Leptospiraceae bacterium]
MENESRSNAIHVYLVRFAVIFVLWEVIAFPLRLLFFSADTNTANELMTRFLPGFFWTGIFTADIISVAFIGVLCDLLRPVVPRGIYGGLTLGFLFSVSAYSGLVVMLISLNILPVFIILKLGAYLFLQSLILCTAYFIQDFIS